MSDVLAHGVIDPSSALFQKVTQVIRETFMDLESPITRETVASEVRGWTSLGHVYVIMAIEHEFSVQIPEHRMFNLRNVGELVDLIADLRGKS